jgi:hypothetical protein
MNSERLYPMTLTLSPAWSEPSFLTVFHLSGMGDKIPGMQSSKQGKPSDISSAIQCFRASCAWAQQLRIGQRLAVSVPRWDKWGLCSHWGFSFKGIEVLEKGMMKDSFCSSTSHAPPMTPSPLLGHFSHFNPSSRGPTASLSLLVPLTKSDQEKPYWLRKFNVGLSWDFQKLWYPQQIFPLHSLCGRHHCNWMYLKTKHGFWP